jgi:hypothetical protein
MRFVSYLPYPIPKTSCLIFIPFLLEKRGPLRDFPFFRPREFSRMNENGTQNSP